MTEKLTAAEIERLRPTTVTGRFKLEVWDDALRALCDMASASLVASRHATSDEDKRTAFRSFNDPDRPLRKVADAYKGRPAGDGEVGELIEELHRIHRWHRFWACDKAADEITSLRERLARAEKECQEIADMASNTDQELGALRCRDAIRTLRKEPNHDKS